MWNFCSPIQSDTLRRFETIFHFNINPALRDFLLAHNGGIPRHCNFPTSVKERRVAAILDFAEGGNAWDINRRMRKILGPKFLVFAIDKTDNFICLRRDKLRQDVVIWNHITNALEECIWDIPMLLLQWTGTVPAGKE